MAFCCVLFAEKRSGYTVASITGKVTYEVSNGEWAEVKAGMTLDTDANVNVGLNSTLVVEMDGTKYTIKPMKKGTVEKLTSDVLASHKITKSNVAPASVKSKKAVITAASRASDAMEDLDWDEDEYYEID